jgi:hypothetical protein
MADERKTTGIRRSVGSLEGRRVDVLRPAERPVLELERVTANDLVGEVAKSRILGAAHDFLREQGLADEAFDFSLSFSLSW